MDATYDLNYHAALRHVSPNRPPERVTVRRAADRAGPPSHKRAHSRGRRGSLQESQIADQHTAWIRRRSEAASAERPDGSREQKTAAGMPAQKLASTIQTAVPE